MSIAALLASTLVVQAPGPSDAVEVAYPEMLEGRSAAAISKMEDANARDADHPARLINLGIAYARAGAEAKARALFAKAAGNTARYWLETSSGEWVDAREIARTAITKLDSGEFSAPQFATR